MTTRLAIAFAVHSLFAFGQDPGVTRLPAAPRGCQDLQFELSLIDISRSMTQGGLFDRVRASVAQRIRAELPGCTLAMVATFGLTADLRAASFVEGPESRAALVSVVERLRATHLHTNFDEAAKTVELLSYQLRDAYGAPANRLVVRVHSDFVGSPSAGKPGFSIAEYLARRMNAEYRRLPGDAAQAGVVRIGAPPPPSKAPAPPRSLPVRGLAITALAAVAAVLVAVRVLRRSVHAGHPLSRLDALTVTEALHRSGAPPTTIVSRREVPVAAGVPAVFSTERSNATYVVTPFEGEPSGEMFRVEPLAGGQAYIVSRQPRTTVDGEPLDHRFRRRVSLRSAVAIRIGARVFTVGGVFESAARERRGTAVFSAEAARD